jgi:hypothetical protein
MGPETGNLQLYGCRDARLIENFAFPMKNKFCATRERLFFRSPMLLASVTLVCMGISLFMLYETLMHQHAAYLANQVAEQLNWLEMIGRSNHGDAERTLDQYVQYGAKHHLLGKTGEFVLAVAEGDNVRFLAQRDSSTANLRLPMTENPQSDPVRYALAGNVGTTIGFDQRGHRVLAAFAPVPHFKWGIVAKTDLREVLSPFLQATSILSATVLIVLVAGILSVEYLGRPLIQDLEQSQRCVAMAIQESKQGLQHQTA